MTSVDRWFISVDGDIYDYPADEQARVFPEESHESYATREEAEAAQKVLYRQWCDQEFGEDHDHDAEYAGECAAILGTMRGDSSHFTFHDHPSYDSQQDHYERFGRPAFPNEY